MATGQRATAAFSGEVRLRTPSWRNVQLAIAWTTFSDGGAACVLGAARQD